MPASSTITRFCSLVCLLGTMDAHAMASEFCVETEIRQASGTDQKVVGSNITLFTEQKVYDFTISPTNEVFICDLNEQMLVVMDRQHRVRCELPSKWLLKLNTTLNSYASKSKNPQKRFLSNPKFERKFDAQLQQLTLTHRHLGYVLKGQQPHDVAMAQRYGEFADWSARLNAIRSGLPANPRLTANRELANLALVPKRVTKLTGENAPQLYSTHQYRWNLTEADRERIKSADQHHGEFRPISPEEFFSPR